MKMENWKAVLGHKETYNVSDLGNVKNVKTGKILKPQKNTHGYMHVVIHNEGKRSTRLLAQLVWEAFNGPIPEGMQVNHINEDKTDNRLENLNLMTPKENSNWGTRNRRVATKLINGKMAKCVLQYDLNGMLLKEWPSVREVERQTGFAATHISAGCLGKKTSPYGYVWKYKI